MRIQPLHLRHHTGQFDLLVCVILGIESVVSNDRNRQAEETDTGHQDAKLDSHCNTSSVAAVDDRR